MSFEPYITCLVCGRRFRTISFTHLRKHGLTTNEYRERYGLDFLVSPLSRARISKAHLKHTPLVPYRPLEPGTVLEGVRAAGGSEASMRRLRPYLYSQAVTLYGSWGGALKAAGLEPAPTLVWSKQAVQQSIQERRRQGLALSLTRVQAEDVRLYGAAQTWYGSWERAVAAAGFRYQDITKRKPRDLESIKKALWEWVERHGPVNFSKLKQTDEPLQHAIHEHYGRLSDFVREFGFPHKPLAFKWTPGLLLQAIRERAAQGQPMTRTAARRENRKFVAAAERFFGTWDAAVKKACPAL